MKRKSSITSLSWIPSEAIEGSMRVPFDVGVAHYDPPPPDAIENLKALEALRASDRFRFANRLSAWIEVDEDGNVTDAGYDGGGHMGATTMKIGRVARTFEAIALPDLRKAFEAADGEDELKTAEYLSVHAPTNLHPDGPRWWERAPVISRLITMYDRLRDFPRATERH